MSAIWGRINVIGNINKDICKAMDTSMSEYVLDRIDGMYRDNVYFACGHQYITNEAVNDISPIYDKEGDMYFNADCFLYNRKDVINAILSINKRDARISKENLDKCGDSQLAFHAFKVFGYSFVKQLRGSFAFVIYDISKKMVHLLSDHISSRYLAYYFCDDYLCYGSIYKPIKVCLGSKLELNKEFIIKSYYDQSARNFYDPSITVYKDVYHVNNASHVTIDLNTKSIKSENYWNPIKSVKILKGKTDDEYKELFLNTYNSVITGMLRSRKQTGIFLSGGYDSSSVTAMAAPRLQEEGKKLYSYTAVPASQFKSTINHRIIEDETYLIQEQVKWYKNLVPHFINNDDINCLKHIDVYHKKFDMPIKAAINIGCLMAMGQAAVDDGCSIVLSGANGNATVSYGSTNAYVTKNIFRFRWKTAIHEINCYCRHFRCSRKKYLRYCIKSILNYFFTNPTEEEYFLKADDKKKYSLRFTDRKGKKTYGNYRFVTTKQRKNFVYMPIQYMQKGFYLTNQGLTQGFLQLDPTLSVDIIELCMSFPDKCFTKDGEQRRLIKDYMRGLIPPIITDDKTGFGVQSADSAFCVNRDWDMVRDFTYDILDEPSLRDYFDESKLDNFIKKLHDNEGNLDKFTARDVAIIGSLGCFLREFRKKYKA